MTGPRGDLNEKEPLRMKEPTANSGPRPVTEPDIPPELTKTGKSAYVFSYWRFVMEHLADKAEGFEEQQKAFRAVQDAVDYLEDDDPGQIFAMIGRKALSDFRDNDKIEEWANAQARQHIRWLREELGGEP